MNELKLHKKLLFLLIVVLMTILLLYGDLFLFTISYFFAFIFLLQKCLRINSRKTIRFVMAITYVMILLFQLSFCALVIFYPKTQGVLLYLSRFLGTILLVAPFIVERYVIISKYTQFYLPSISEVKTVSFEEVIHSKNMVVSLATTVKKAKDKVTINNIKELLHEAPRHSFMQYINENSLPQEYFDIAYANVNDPYVYIIISNTGSAVSEVISTFTQKQYNHASISFDPDLKTIISYNGGEKVYPPGLNHEMLEYFNKKEDASIIIYKLKASASQKRQMIDKIKEINTEGSAYNVMGLIVKFKHKPNMMFCSQFVYNMLKLVGLEYFHKNGLSVKPTDLIELDYYRKLEFHYEIKFN